MQKIEWDERCADSSGSYHYKTKAYKHIMVFCGCHDAFEGCHLKSEKPPPRGRHPLEESVTKLLNFEVEKFIS